MANKYCLTIKDGVMKNILQKVAITWIAVMGMLGLYKERQSKLVHQERSATLQNEIVLDDFEIASFHNS